VIGQRNQFENSLPGGRNYLLGNQREPIIENPNEELSNKPVESVDKKLSSRRTLKQH